MGLLDINDKPSTTRSLVSHTLPRWTYTYGTRWLSYLDAARLTKMLASPMRSGLLSSDCETGKTTTAFIMALIRSIGNDTSAPYRPVFVIIPSKAVRQMADERLRHFRKLFRVRVFHGSAKNGKNHNFLAVHAREGRARVHSLYREDEMVPIVTSLTCVK